MEYQAIRPYIGELSQAFQVKEYRFTGGRSDGARAVDVDNGAGVAMTVLLDRCLDISHLRYRGASVCYVAPCGIVAPQYFGDKGLEFLRSFFVGFLTTGGLSTIGSPCEEGGEALGLHGRISNTPAENVSVRVEETPSGPVARIGGTMREARLFGEYLTLTREISCAYGERRFTVTDTVENKSFKKLPHMQLYHCNYGYPMLSESARLLVPTLKVTPRTEHAASGLAAWNRMEPPQDGYEEMCYYHELAADGDGRTLAGIYNPELGAGVVMRFSRELLDHFVEWKMMGKGEYVLGLEPCNAGLETRPAERERGALKFLEPGEKKTYRLTVEFLEGEEEYRKAEAEVQRLTESAR